MPYRNKTYVAFASEDISYYRLMQAWKERENIAFNFLDAHALNIARDTSQPETIKNRLRERLVNTKQAVLLGSPMARQKGGNGYSFLAYEVKVLLELGVPIVIANLDQSRAVVNSNIPQPITDAGVSTVSVSFQAKIIMYALDHFVAGFGSSPQRGPCYYPAGIYQQLGI